MPNRKDATFCATGHHAPRGPMGLHSSAWQAQRGGEYGTQRSRSQSCLKNLAHLSNFFTQRTVGALLNRPGHPVVLRTRSYRTLRDGSFGGVFPGTSCQATIARSLRDNSQQALARCCCEMSASASRRDDTDRSLARSAWESDPGKEPSRRVRYDRAQRMAEVFLVEMCAVFLEEAGHFATRL